MQEAFTHVIKAAGPATGGLALFGVGIYGGQYACRFKAPFDDYASWGCMILMVAGGSIAIIQIIRQACKKTITHPAENPKITKQD
jgi:hypothetical protein